MCVLERGGKKETETDTHTHTTHVNHSHTHTHIHTLDTHIPLKVGLGVAGGALVGDAAVVEEDEAVESLEDGVLGLFFVFVCVCVCVSV